METIEAGVIFETKPPHVYEAINNVSRRVAKEGISKSRKNQMQGYNFRGIDDVYNALAVPMAEEHLCILPRVLSREITERQTQKGGVLFYVVLDMEFDFVSAKDGSRHTIRVVGEAMDSADKATNKAMSAAYKYACMQTFCIPTEGDNDADATTHEVKPMIHDPMDRENLNVTDSHKTYADSFAKALESSPDAVRQVEQDMKEETDIDGRKWDESDYRAVWSLMDSKTRASVKRALAMKVAA